MSTGSRHRERLAIGGLVVLTPTVVHARGEQLLFLFLYFPLVVVLASLLIGVRTWKPRSQQQHPDRE